MTFRRMLPMTMLLVALAHSPAAADPAIAVRYEKDALTVTLEGSYAGAYYRVLRSNAPNAAFSPIRSQATLCTGDCYVSDAAVIPGATYFYRFDLEAPNGASVSYGPYAVTVPALALSAHVSPNPSRAAVNCEISMPGSNRIDGPIPAEARILDLQGRTMRVIFSGSLARGISSLSWDGRNASNQRVGEGVYFLRLATPLGVSTTRVIRIH